MVFKPPSANTYKNSILVEFFFSFRLFEFALDLVSIS